MQIIESISELRKVLKKCKAGGRTIGFVPTMGFFHHGHLKLMEQAKSENDVLVVSLFVNPTQFGPAEDFRQYPRDLERDKDMAASVKTDILFTPREEEMYPKDFQTWVEVEALSKPLCGKMRPGHFKGVATVVAKLFSIVRPDKAYFGLKDYQQFLVIRKMVEDLNFDLKVIGIPTVRDEDGLATSSRNIYLEYDERQEALVLYNSLNKAQRLLQSGIKNSRQIKKVMTEMMAAKDLIKIEYLEIVDKDTLEPVENIDNAALVALAAKVGKARLIDSMVISSL